MTLDWGTIGSAVIIAAAVVPIGAAMFGFVRAIRKAWNYTLGQRRGQQTILNRLAVQSTRRYVDDLLGISQFALKKEDFDVHYYRLAGCWVCVWYYDDRVAAFSITVTRERLWVHTLALTHQQLRVRLGRDNLQSMRELNGDKVYLGARRMSHARVAAGGGNPAAYQSIWLSYNDAGVGDLLPALAPAPYTDDEHPPSHSTANTLTVIAPAIEIGSPTDAESQMKHHDQFGVDLDIVRRAVDRPVRHLLWRTRLRLKLRQIRS